MELSIHEDAEVASLRKFNKILKYFFVILAILAIVPLVLTIVYANRKMERQQEIQQKREILAKLQHQLEDQNYKYQFSDMNISAFRIALEKNTTSKPIRVIELQENSLEEFESNVIPGVEALILDNNPLTKFESNYFPNLWNLSIMTGKLETFSNNYLVLVDDLKVNQNIDYFDNNTLSITHIKLNSTRSFTRNHMEKLTSLSLLDTYGCDIIDNNFPELQKFEFNEVANTDIYWNNTFANNTFGKITSWNYSADSFYHWWIFNNNSFPLLTSFMMTNKITFNSLNDNNFPKLTELVLLAVPKRVYIIEFNMTNNLMPELVSLNVNSDIYLKNVLNNNFSSIKTLDLSLGSLAQFTNNYFKQLESANFSINLRLIKFNISAPKLKTLDISQTRMPFLDEIQAPLLEMINIEHNGIIKINLTLPALKIIKAFSGSIQQVNIMNGSQILDADFTSNHIKQFNQNWSSIVNLSLSTNRLKTLDVSNYSKLVNLSVSNNHLEKIYLGNLTQLKHLDLSINNMAYFNSSFYIELPNLQTLNLFNNHFHEINITSPHLLELNCSSNVNMTNLRNINAPNLNKLAITNSNVSQVFGLKFDNLQSFQFSGNPIKVFSNNTFNISQMDTLFLNQLQTFDNNYIDGYDTALSNPVPFIMTSQSLSEFKGNDLIFGKIQFKPSTFSLKKISKNDLTVQNGEIIISSIYLQSFVQNNVRFCSNFSIANSELNEFQNNTIFNVTNISITNTNLKNLNKNNNIKGAKNLILDNNKLTQTVIKELIEIELKGIQYISLKNNPIADKTQAEVELKEAYPTAVISI